MKGCSDCKWKEQSDSRRSTFCGSFLWIGLLLGLFLQTGWAIPIALILAGLITWQFWNNHDED